MNHLLVLAMTKDRRMFAQLRLVTVSHWLGVVYSRVALYLATASPEFSRYVDA